VAWLAGKGCMYSALDHLARSLWLGRYDRDNLMALLHTAYFDASGKKDAHPSVTVAGAVASCKKWNRFNEEWAAVLKQERVKEFHATDFAASLGEYESWKGDKPRRSQFLRRLIEIIRQNVNKLFIATVEMDGWSSVNKEYLLEEYFFSPFALAGYSVTDLVLQWREKREKRRRLEIIFEDGEDLLDWRGLKKLCAGLDVIPERLSKEKAVPCQVGDLVAWKTRIASQNTMKINRKIDPLAFNPDLLRQALTELRSLDTVLVTPVVNGVYSRAALLRTCKKSRVPKRSTFHPSL
jgi:hypothetical protein